MILMIGKDKEVEGISNESKFSELGIWKRTHIKKWISQHLEILGKNCLR